MLSIYKCMSISLSILFLTILIGGCSHNGVTSTSPVSVTDNLTISPSVPSKESHPYQDIVNAVKALQPTETPKHLIRYDGNRTFDEFDVNECFAVLTNISVKEGYTLDYVYHFNGSAGYPVLYIRRLSQEPYPDDEELYDDIGLTRAYINHDIELQESIMSGETLAWQKSIVINDTERGFFEYLVLNIMGGQFYLWWHGGYNDLTIICDRSGLKNVIEEVQKYYEISEDTVLAAYQLDLTPEVRFTDDTVIITAIFFTNWGGFRQGTFTISRDFPHTIINTEWETLVEYDCGCVI